MPGARSQIPRESTPLDTSERQAASAPARLPLARLAVVFLAALFIRLLYLWQLRDSPLVDVVMGDSTVYDRWARAIAAGDWMGRDVFFQAPLYPYFVAIVYALFGPSTWAVRIVQILVGSLSCVVLSAAAARWFSPRVGLYAGLGLALYAPAIFYDALIQKEVLALFFVTSMLLLMALHLERTRWWLAAGMGILLGLLALTRENGLIVVPVVAGWLVLGTRGRDKNNLTPPWSVRCRPLAAFVFGLAVVLVPVGMRNQVIGGRFLLTTSNMGSNLYIGNQPGARGYYLPLKEWRAEAQFEQQDAQDLAEQATGRTMSPAEVSRYWLWRTLRHIGAHPVEWTGLMLRKWFMVWNASEHMDTESIEAYAHEASLLRALHAVLHFGVFAPLAAVGVFLTRRQWRRYAVWYVMILALAGSIALFFVFGRFRYPMAALLIPFAAAGAVLLVERIRALDFKPVAVSLVLAALTAAASNTARFRQYDPLAITWANVGGALSDLGRFDEAIGYFQRSLQSRPNRPETHYLLALAHDKRGDAAEAEKYYHLALAGQDKPVDVLNRLTTLLIARGAYEEAATMLARMIEVDRQSPETHYRVAFGYAQIGRRGEAERHYREAIRIKPAHVGALNNLAMLLAEDGKYAAAREIFLQALTLVPDNADVHNNVGQTLLDEGRREEARPYFQEALRLNPQHELARENLAATAP